MSNSSQIHNLNTPLAFLYPDQATQLEIYRYCSVATLGVSPNELVNVTACYELMMWNSGIRVEYILSCRHSLQAPLPFSGEHVDFGVLRFYVSLSVHARPELQF